MKRRTLLASVGAGFAGLAGCSGVVEEFDPSGDTPSNDPGPPGDRPDGSTVACSQIKEGFHLDSVPVRNLPELGSRFADLGCPRFDWAARTVCYHTATVPDEDVVLMTRTPRVFVSELADVILEFALVNRTDREITTHPSAWTILEPDGGDWSLVASDGPDCTRYLSHEGVHWWHLGVGQNVRSTDVNVTAASASLDPGVYAFAVPAFLPSGDVMCVAPFEIVESGSVESETPVPDSEATPADVVETPTPAADAASPTPDRTLQ